MKVIRASLATLLTVLSTPSFADAAPIVSTVQAAITTAPAVVTPSPLEAAESALEDAKQHANQTLHVVIQDKRNYDQVEDSQDLINQEVDFIVAAQPNTTLRWVKERKRKLKQREHADRRLVRDHEKAAKRASKAYKRAALELERQRISAGMPEFVYERDYNRDEERAERMEEEAENHGEAATSHVEAFYDRVKNELERRDEREERAREEASEREEHHQEEEEGVWDADNASRQNGSSRARRHGADRHTNAVDAGLATDAAPLNLTSVGPSQEFLLSFACAGFLAFVVFAVQMGNRRSIQQGRQPLLGA